MIRDEEHGMTRNMWLVLGHLARSVSWLDLGHLRYGGDRMLLALRQSVASCSWYLRYHS